MNSAVAVAPQVLVEDQFGNAVAGESVTFSVTGGGGVVAPVTAVVTGECSSAMLWPFAACERRLVTPYSVLLFHPMKWQSEEHVGLAEAADRLAFIELAQEIARELCESDQNGFCVAGGLEDVFR